jgi:hypothetical protein
MGRFLILCLCLSGCCIPGAERKSLLGTYELHICKSPCSEPKGFGDVGTGYLVLQDDALTATDIAQIGNLLLDDADQAPRACFAGKRAEGSKSYAFIDPSGATGWHYKDNVVSFSLFRSADAGYRVVLTPKGNTLVGRGVSWGVGAAITDYPPDVVEAHRIGPADLSVCRRRLDESAS